MKTAQTARFARFDASRIDSQGHARFVDSLDSFDVAYQPTRYDSRAYEQCDMRTHSMDRFSLQIDTLI
jgi:hypothetical protein